jgi:tetratricopeptide (TPR) repeat protein
MPALPEIYINRGVVYMKQRRWADAIGQIDKGLDLNPEEAEKAYFNRGLAREQMDDFRGAYADFRKAAELAPEWEAPKKELARFTVRRPA